MFAIPDLRALATRAVAAFRAHLPGVDALLPGNNVGPTAKVIAGEMWGLFGRLAWVMRQAFPLTAEGEWLDRHADQYGMARRPAAPGAGRVALAISSIANVAAGAVFTRADGARFSAVQAATLLSSGEIDVQSLDVGALSNTEAGVALTIVSGVTSGGAVAAVAGTGGIVGGSDIESDDDLRERLLFRLRFTPAGGAPADYVRWAMEVPGVTEVYVERWWDGPGTVRIFPVFGDIRPGGIPNAGDIAAIVAHLEPLQPAGAAVTVTAPVAHPIAVTIGGLTPNTVEVQSAVMTSLREMVAARRRVGGADPGIAGLDFMATSETFSRSWLWQAVAEATGETRHWIDAPATDVTLAVGELPTLGVVTIA